METGESPVPMPLASLPRAISHGKTSRRSAAKSLRFFNIYFGLSAADVIFFICSNRFGPSLIQKGKGSLASRSSLPRCRFVWLIDIFGRDETCWSGLLSCSVNQQLVSLAQEGADLTPTSLRAAAGKAIVWITINFNELYLTWLNNL